MGQVPINQKRILLGVWQSRQRPTLAPHYQTLCHAWDIEEALLLGGKNNLENLSPHQKCVLAQSYRDQGRYEEALDLLVTVNSLLCDELFQIIVNEKAARDREDQDFCSCKSMPVEQKQVWSSRHDKFVSLYSCPECQEINITPIQLKPDEIKKYHQWVAAEKENATR